MVVRVQGLAGKGRSGNSSGHAPEPASAIPTAGSIVATAAPTSTEAMASPACGRLMVSERHHKRQNIERLGDFVIG